ncbi:MAG: DEAD/DEAH box helicase [Thermodesulfobacteriota bacterium]
MNYALSDMIPNPLTLFHPLIKQWFQNRIGDPTDAQQQAWPKIAAGEHLLITAPTGSGKTLAAFLWALNQLITRQWPAGMTSLIYVSPLRALNYDIQRNLMSPLEELRNLFQREGKNFPDIHVLTRSGDTPQSDRRQMLRYPPEILITTPESLNLLLSSKGGRSILGSLSTVILDEIHAVFGTKRGVYLMTAVDRLVRLSGEFQRVALSATIQPLGVVADFVAGLKVENESGTPRYVPRPIAMISSGVRKDYQLRVSFSQGAASRAEGLGQDSFWDPFVHRLKKIIAGNRSTLIFVNSRRLCEMLTLRINQDEEEPIAYAHHGSLSLEIRAEVERRLKEGQLRAIVATHSLELGIDIGALDEVILVQSPFSISSAIQRVGRSGHRVNQASRGSLFPTHPKDLLEAAVLAPAILSHDIESFGPTQSPLDVLAQVIVSMVGVEVWQIDHLFTDLKASYPYQNLRREEFDLVLNMLAGRYADSRIRELKPLISIDRIENTVSARRGALQTLYFSGGVIPDRGYFHLRHQQTNARIGDLDEEFVWEAEVGDTFSLGTQNWRIEQITHNDVLVSRGRVSAAAPFWKGEENGRDFHFSERIGKFLEEADYRLGEPDFAGSLERKNCMDGEAIGELLHFLERQKEETGCSLPHRHHLVIELVSAGPGGTPQAVLHTMWGGKVNRPLAMVLDAAWEDQFGYRPEIYVSNDSIVLQLAQEISAGELMSLVDSTRVESLLRRRLEGSGFFGARFRECAGRALLLPKGKFNQRTPLWLSRLRSQRLLEAVMRYEDFPILLETWRTCIQDEFDLENLKKVLNEMERGAISWTEVHTSRPSPFAQSDWWRQVNQYMYMDDSLKPNKRSRLRESLLREVVFTPGLRPTVCRKVVEQFEKKRKRLSSGYSPQTARELLDWVVERVAIPEGEWVDLLEAVRRDHEVDPERFLDQVGDRLVQIQPGEDGISLVAAREMLPQIRAMYGPGNPIHPKPLAAASLSAESLDSEPGLVEPDESAALLGQWLQFYGPVTAEFVRRTLGVERKHLQLVLEDLIDSQKVIQGQLVTDGGPDEICDSENFEILLRSARAEAVPSFEPLDIEWLPLLLAEYQGMTKAEDGAQDKIETLRAYLGQLNGYPAEAELWESEIFPARLHPYDPSWLDSLMQEGDFFWLGSEDYRITFCFEPDIDLLLEEPGQEKVPGSNGNGLRRESPPPDCQNNFFRDPAARYNFSTLLEVSQSSDAEAAKRLWEEVWKGRVTNDTFITLRRAILNRFDLKGMMAKNERARDRMSRRRRLSLVTEKKNYPFAGNWRLIQKPEIPDDLLETEERRKDRVRLLLDRYGILFREILQKEWPAFRWSALFRALRLMELSSEVISGIFFHGIPGPQFISQRGFRRLHQKLPEKKIFWINAADPGSLCGLQIDGLRGMLPPRVPSTHLVYRGKDLKAISKRNGKELSFLVPHDDPDLPGYFISLQHLLTRTFQPWRRIVIETINDERASESPYIPALRKSFDVSIDPEEVVLFRKTK